jgi:hypothetical protein
MTGTEDAITVDDLTITPLKADYKLVHPALGSVNGTAFIGVWFPCMISTQKKDGTAKNTVKDLLFLITSERQKILANDSVLRERGWRLEYKPTKFKNRWTFDSIEAYLNGADVDPASVLTAVVEAYERFIEFTDPRDYLYHALWDAGTYFHFLFSAYPYAYHGGTTSTGKTKALTVSSLFAFNAILSNNMSTSSIFRLIQNARCTLLLDETEKLYTRMMDSRIQEFRSIMLSGYKRGGQAVYRVEKDKDTEAQNTVPFEVYGPKRIANIEGLEDVVSNRCKTTIHRRSVNEAVTKVDPGDHIESEEWATLRGQLCILFLQHWKEAKAIYENLNPEELEGLDGREFELWRPIVALAKFFDSCVANSKTTFCTRSLSTQTTPSSQMIELAQDSAKQANVENLTETGEVILIQVLLDSVQEDDFVSVKNIRDKMLLEYDEQPKFVNSYWIGRTLKRLGFKDKRRVGTGYQYMLTVADIKDVAERMGVTHIVRKKNPTLPDHQKTLDSSEHSEPSEHSERVENPPSEATIEENIVCGHCKKWQQGGCPHPNPKGVVSTAVYAKTCREYEELDSTKDDELPKGATAVFKGTFGRLTKDE